jgi:hypothetical protein
VLAVGVVLTFTGLSGPVPEPALAAAASAPVETVAPPDTAPPPTINEFIPEDVAISDCISAVPKPGCGSEARGGWHQYLVAVALAGGLAVVGWRIVAGVRRRPTRPA